MENWLIILMNIIILIIKVEVMIKFILKLFNILEINLVKYMKIISNPLIKVRNIIIEYK